MRELEDKELLEKGIQMVSAFAVPEIPEIERGVNIGQLITEKMLELGGIREKDIFVVASKIVSKSEGRRIDLTQIHPSQEATDLYRRLGKKTPELVQLILDEAQSYKIEHDVIVAKHRLGFQLTSAGVDRESETEALVIPENPDRSAKSIMDEVYKITGKHVAIIISDSEGRADRKGAGAISIGVAGINPLRVAEVKDLMGNIKVTEETISDMIAAQASFIMGQRGNNRPIVCVRGAQYKFDPDANLASIIYK